MRVLGSGQVVRDGMMLAGGESASEATAIYVAPLREDFAALKAQSAMIFKATKAAMDSKKRLDHTKLLLSLPKTGMTKDQLDRAVKQARKRIRDSYMVKERVLKERGSRPRSSLEHSSLDVYESKTEDDANLIAAETLALLAMGATEREPQLQDEAGDFSPSVEQALRATKYTSNFPNHATSGAAMCAASELQSVDARLSAKEQEIAQLREQLERDKATAEQDISYLRTQLQTMRVMLRSQLANVA